MKDEAITCEIDLQINALFIERSRLMKRLKNIADELKPLVARRVFVDHQNFSELGARVGASTQQIRNHAMDYVEKANPAMLSNYREKRRQYLKQHFPNDWFRYQISPGIDFYRKNATAFFDNLSDNPS